MRLALIRDRLTEKSTTGELSLNGAHLCFTLEDRYRGDDINDKVRGSTCIPCGRYEIVITHSQRFGIDMPLLLNVPGFSGVRIHSGNTDRDTEGCVLVGTTRGEDIILGSRIAYELVFGLIRDARAKNELVHIEVRLANGATEEGVV